MELTEIARRRLQTQRLVGKTFTSPAEVVRWFGAVQSQEYEWSKWALGLRLDNTTSEGVEESIRDGSIVRSWPMRGTVHMMPAEDVRWMLELMAYRQNQKFTSFLNRLGLTEEVLLKIRSVFEKQLADGFIERRKLHEALDAAGLMQDRSWGMHSIGYWSQAGVICPGPLNGKQPTVGLLDMWVPKEKSLDLSKRDALKVIAERYFQSHGPATLQDLTWWTGLSAVESAEGLESIKAALVSKESDGKTYWMSKETAQMPLDTVSSVHILPPFDEFTVAYKNRDAALDPADLQRLQHGIFKPNILIDGKIVGTWSRKIQKKDMAIELGAKPLKAAEKKQLLEKIEVYTAFMQLPAVIVSKEM